MGSRTSQGVNKLCMNVERPGDRGCGGIVQEVGTDGKIKRVVRMRVL